ncbi:MAG: AAA family ATPase [Trueperaceae bacterium]
MMVVVFGLPGSGKSTMAVRLARRLEAVWISSDAIRGERGLSGDYSKESIAAVYREMMTRAGSHLTDGAKVVLDGSFSNRRFRQQARELAGSHGVPLALIHMVADDRVTLRRVGRRRRLTEAGPEAYQLLKRNFDPIEEEHLTLDSSKTRVKGLLKQALHYLDVC